MILQYRNFRSQIATCNISIMKRGVRDAKGTIMQVVETWGIRGELLYETPAQIKAATLAMEQAFSQDNGDLVYFMIDGRTPSAHALYSAQTVSGVKVVVPPSFPNGEGIECATYRSFYVELEATKMARGANQNIIRFQESLSIRGGGWRIEWIEKPKGEPVAQQVRESTICTVIQTGSALGLFRMPAVPPCVLPQYLTHEYPDIDLDSGDWQGQAGQFDQINIPMRWRYEMKMPFRVNNLTPNLWTR